MAPTDLFAFLLLMAPKVRNAFAKVATKAKVAGRPKSKAKAKERETLERAPEMLTFRQTVD